MELNLKTLINKLNLTEKQKMQYEINLAQKPVFATTELSLQCKLLLLLYGIDLSVEQNQILKENGINNKNLKQLIFNDYIYDDNYNLSADEQTAICLKLYTLLDLNSLEILTITKYFILKEYENLNSNKTFNIMVNKFLTVLDND